MNYLAHARLSFDQPFILIGNMISDHVKGKKQYGYPAEVHKGILLHRAIDRFTDDHPVTKDMKEFFRTEYRLYSGAFADVVYDHFLANDPGEFQGTEELSRFTQWTYATLESNAILLPEGFRNMLPYMKSQDWLTNYKHRWGIEKSFSGLKHRARYIPDITAAFRIFEAEYDALGQCYSRFYPELKRFAAHHLAELQKA